MFLLLFYFNFSERFKILLSMLIFRFVLLIISSRSVPRIQTLKMFVFCKYPVVSHLLIEGVYFCYYLPQTFGILELRLRICFAILLLYLLNDVLKVWSNVKIKGPPEGKAKALFHNSTKYAFHTQSLIKSKFSNHSKFIYT